MTYYLSIVMLRSYTDRRGSIISFISSFLCMHYLVPKGQYAQVHGPNPLCVLRWTSKVSHLICITIFGGEEYCLIILQITFYTHIHKHIITFEISFSFHLTYFESNSFSLKIVSCIYSKSVIKSSIIHIFNNKHQYADNIHL